MEIDKSEIDGTIPLNQVIKEHTGFDCLPATHEEIDELAELGGLFLNNFNKEINNFDNPSKFGCHVEKLFIDQYLTRIEGYTGYPDAIYKSKTGRECYCEIKCFNELDNRSRGDTFSVSSCKRISQSAPHLLIGFEYKNTPTKQRIINSCIVKDVGNLSLKIKIEYATTNLKLYDEK
jgi:hypothetical protein